ncbi:hypothetical protein EDC04DRAFT_2709057 [Pisolithus marmoratus]|nr:hypothetical protein EDC04DRAFT_2709057 [Pisolithus marmoratus]
MTSPCCQFLMSCGCALCALWKVAFKTGRPGKLRNQTVHVNYIIPINIAVIIGELALSRRNWSVFDSSHSEWYLGARCGQP